MQRARILHGCEPVALEHELGHPHQHGEEIVKQRGRVRLQELAPHFDGRAKTEQRAHVELGRSDDIDDAALLHLQRIALLAKSQREGRGEPLADHRKLGIGIHALAKTREPCLPRIVGHGLNPTP